MKPRSFVILVALALAALAAASPETTERVVLEEIVARVNNEIITLSDMERSRSLLRQELSEKFRGEELGQRYQQEQGNLLRDLIDQALLVQRANDMGVSVEAEVIKQLDRIRQNQGLATMEELERAVAAQGMDFEDFKHQLRQQMLTQQVIQREVAGRVLIDAEQVREYYLQHQQELVRPERIRLREILVSTKGFKPEELPAREERLREVLGKIRRGEKFEELARSYSDAPTARDGGELGYFEPEKMAASIREVVSKLRESGVTDPLPTPEGYLLLQLVEHMPAGIPPFEKVEGELMQKLYYDQVQPALREFLSTLRRDAFVYVKPGYVDSGAIENPKKPVRRRGSKRRRD